ncbi:Glutamate receptor ionotropic, delta-2-like 14 [Homarus americanus]|uniref:Glutamate receptor ionotropic, delta-2-like 14 n=1 Tax=Homarus americanus TaxID=6706 RepID=A0A8J5MUK1_HOMAM|nr:Glutamate receptor ionotropic, delta-2-like 14 [Homarus americanus]
MEMINKILILHVWLSIMRGTNLLPQLTVILVASSTVYSVYNKHSNHTTYLHAASFPQPTTANVEDKLESLSTNSHHLPFTEMPFNLHTHPPSVYQLATRRYTGKASTKPFSISPPLITHTSPSSRRYRRMIKLPVRDEDSLAVLLSAIVIEQLRECVLVVAADQGFWRSPVMDRLLRLPNLRQVVNVVGVQDLQKAVLKAQQCRGYLLLLSDPAPLYTLTDPVTGAWDYDGRYVVAGLSREQLHALTITNKGRKTDHIVGVIRSGDAGQYVVVMNQLYQREKMARVFTWTTSRSSTIPVNLFPDKITDLQGAVLNVITFELPPNIMYQRARNGSVLHRYGIDVDAVTALAQVFNFTINFKEPPPVSVAIIDLHQSVLPSSTCISQCCHHRPASVSVAIIDLHQLVLPSSTCISQCCHHRPASVSAIIDLHQLVCHHRPASVSVTIIDLHQSVLPSSTCIISVAIIDLHQLVLIDLHRCIIIDLHQLPSLPIIDLHQLVLPSSTCISELWGEVTSNGTWNGLVGLLGTGEGDIGIANLFITALGGRKEYQEYTTYYEQDTTCFLIQSEAQIPRWQSLALPYTATTWLVILLGLVLTGPLLYCLTKLASFRGEKMANSSLAYTSLYTAGMHFRSTQLQVPTSSSLQVLVVFLWLYIIILTTGYSSNLTAFLTVDRTPPGINTIKELYHSSLTVYGLGPFFGNNMAQSKNDHLRECFLPFNVAVGLQSHSPLKKNFDRVVSWIYESGLMKYWTKQSLVLFKKYKREEEEVIATPESEVAGGGGVSLTLEHVQGVFFILGLGYVAAQLVFMLEMFLCSRGNTRYCNCLIDQIASREISYHRSPTTDLLPQASYHRPPTTGLLPQASYHRPPTTGLLPQASYHRSPTTDLLPQASYHRPPTTDLLPQTSYHRPTTDLLPQIAYHRPPTIDLLPQASYHRPPTTDLLPHFSTKSLKSGTYCKLLPPYPTRALSRLKATQTQNYIRF